MDRLVIQKNIYQQKFEALMDICFQESEYFSLTRFSGHAKPDFSHFSEHLMRKLQGDIAMQDAILQSLSPFQTASIETTEWFCISTVPFLYIDVYKVNADSLRTLLSHFDNLFLQFHPELTIQSADLCFFRDDQLGLAPVFMKKSVWHFRHPADYLLICSNAGNGY